MSMFFRYKGSLKFETAADAAKYYALLTSDDNSWYSFVPEELELVDCTLKFKSDGNFGGYGLCERTKDLINKAARNAKSGRVNVDEGDSDESLWNLELISVAHLKKQKEKLLKEQAKRGIMIYSFVGELEFADEAAAAQLFDELSNNRPGRIALLHRMEGQGRETKLAVAGKKVVFEDQVTAKPEIIEDTLKLLEEFAARAVRGMIEVNESDVYGHAKSSRFISAGCI